MPGSVEELFREAGLMPRPGQLEAAETLAWHIEHGARVVFSAPVGWGKTNAVLAALKAARALPALWLVRSLALGARISEDAAVWGLIAFTAAGRERVCPLAERLGDAVHEFCRYYRYKCPYARLPEPPVAAVDWEHLARIAREKGFCAYLAQDLVEADVVVQNYHRRLRPARAFVVDEAHNLLVPREREYSAQALTDAISLLVEKGEAGLARKLEYTLASALTEDGPVTLDISEDERAALRRLHFEALGEGDARLKPVIDMTTAAAVYSEGGRICVYKPSVPYLLHVRPAVFVSATLPREALGMLGAEVELRIPWVVRARALIVEGLTTKWESFDSRMAERYVKLLLRVGRSCRRVIVFAASERVARELRSWATYEEVVPPPGWEGVLLLRARGRFSEGVDLPSECVVVAGCPYLPPSVSERLASVYRRAGIEQAARLARDIPMLVATLQSVGRAWRDPQKPPTVYLADERFARYSGELEEYLEIQTTSLDKL